MFAMLSGRWPRIAADGTHLAALEQEVASFELPVPAQQAAQERVTAAVDRLVEEVVRAQEAAGLDLVTDGQVRSADPGGDLLRALQTGQIGDRGLLVESWRATSALTDRAVAQTVPGPYSLGRRVTEGQDEETRAELTLELAGRLGGELGALAAAGCPMVLVEEPAAIAIGADDTERTLFADAQARLLAPAPDLHAMLVIAGGSAWEAGAGTILTAPYRSYLFDLIAGPDNWYLVRATRGDRGIVCGALDPASNADQAPILDWAARYAASGNGRGPERVGVTNASSLETLAPDAARDVLATLARAARLAVRSPTEAVAEGMDPRAFPTGHGRANRRRRREG